MEFLGGFSVPPGNKRERRVWKLLPDGQVFRRNREPTKSVHLPAGLGHSSDLLPSDIIDGQSFPLRPSVSIQCAITFIGEYRCTITHFDEAQLNQRRQIIRTDRRQ